ncbi:hypothetical protein SDJN03_06898, partial [Cucurbita argyrosperma subsp. sororia]
MNSKSLLVDAKSLLLKASPEEEQLYTFICIESQRSGCHHGHLWSEEQLTSYANVGSEGRLSLWSSTTAIVIRGAVVIATHGARSHDSLSSPPWHDIRRGETSGGSIRVSPISSDTPLLASASPSSLSASTLSASKSTTGSILPLLLTTTMPMHPPPPINCYRCIRGS